MVLLCLVVFQVSTVGSGTAAAFNVTGTTPDGSSVTVRVCWANGGLSRSSFVVGTRYTIIGILTQFNGAAQIKVRSTGDVTP